MGSLTNRFGKEISSEQLGVITKGQEWADLKIHQSTKYSNLHAMSSAGQSVIDACKESNRLVRNFARESITLKQNGKINESLFAFAVALHIMQDSTSPAHRGFQEWTGNESSPQIYNHIKQEATYPGKGSSLDLITIQAWKAYKSNDLAAFSVSCSCYAPPSSKKMQVTPESFMPY